MLQPQKGNMIQGGDSKEQRDTKEQQRKEVLAREYRVKVTTKVATSRPYPYGWCTYYAASRKGITTNYGNAKNWPVTSKEPSQGSILVTYENRTYGHVAYVEAVDGFKVTVSEMNYVGFGVVSKRTVDIRNIPLKGFLN